MSSIPGTPDTSSDMPDRVHPGPAPARIGWTGWIVFAAVLLFLAGLAQLVQGFVALVDDGFYIVRSDGLALSLGYSTWGLVHLLVGALAWLIGLGLLSGNTVARGAAVAV